LIKKEIQNKYYIRGCYDSVGDTKKLALDKIFYLYGSNRRLVVLLKIVFMVLRSDRT